ncbi:hypothetical protein GCM10011386_38680 [Parapedobacter defluvii]|uniref:Uncharacterized protein n=1 Tax=Parapedobacter defluvii TaxID=2045106 RepID=A0ABQ1MTJ8_9SPHI|nr:hypothetical protein [Parapedobacter defluvii]GGC42709.1 hypothetical protein GCM10011386_38680 [Parapedobacter defluvii]
MKTTVIGSNKGNTQNNGAAAKDTAKNEVQAKVGTATDDSKAKAGEVNGKAVAAVSNPQNTEKVLVAEKAEPTKAELRQKLVNEPPAMGLDETIKWVETLHRKKLQREKLIATIDELEAFEVEQLDDAKEVGLDQFQGCELTITDDNGNDFSTKNPFIINAVAQHVKTLCVGKLAEIEGEIRIPH